MKLLKSVLCLFLISVVISYANIKEINWIEEFIQTFESTNSEFKFYNIKANSLIEEDVSVESIESICKEIIDSLDIDENKVNLKKSENQIYVNYSDENRNISVIAIKKSDKESHIMVDILNNKVYKNIEDIYSNINNVLKVYSNDTQINICIAGEYTKKLQNAKFNDILDKILYNMYAEEIDRVEDENFSSINAYSKLLEEKNIKYLDKNMNLNIGIRYSEDDDKTMIYIATPVIKIDY